MWRSGASASLRLEGWRWREISANHLLLVFNRPDRAHARRPALSLMSPHSSRASSAEIRRGAEPSVA
jgi:hypothetical protein